MNLLKVNVEKLKSSERQYGMPCQEICKENDQLKHAILLSQDFFGMWLYCPYLIHPQEREDLWNCVHFSSFTH